MAKRKGRPRASISLRLFRTPAQAAQVRKGKRQRRLSFAALKVDLSKAPLPEFLVGINLPSAGIIREGLDAYVWDADGRKVTGAAEMRRVQGLVDAHVLVEGFAKRNHRRPVAWTGSGNTVQNLGCVAYRGDEGVLYYGVGEGERLQKSEPYPGLVIHQNGRVAIEYVRFLPTGYPGRWNAQVVPRKRSARVHLVVTGQRLVWRGEPFDPYESLEAADIYPDRRHLIQNPYAKMSHLNGKPAYSDKKREIRIMKDFGLDQIMRSPKKYKKALAGNTVKLSFFMTDVGEEKYTVTAKDLSEALEDKGYRIRDSIAYVEKRGKRGDCYIDEPENQLHIRFNRNPYPHHFIAIREGEPQVYYDGVIGGWGNNGGTNPYDLALDLKKSGFRDAILLDNGGDCVLCHHGDEGFSDPARATIPSCEGRKEWAGVILYYAAEGKDLGQSGVTMAKGVRTPKRSQRFVASF